MMGAGYFAFPWYMACLLSVMVCLLSVIGRLCSNTGPLPGHCPILKLVSTLEYSCVFLLFFFLFVCFFVVFFYYLLMYLWCLCCWMGSVQCRS